jgi:parallel beta-helix repeat protein
VGNSFTRTNSIALAFYDNSTVDPRLGLNHHNIAENVFTDVQGGIQLCGVETGGSTIARNWFSRANEFAIQLRESSNYNAIEANVIADSVVNGIVVRGSAMNTIRQNLIDNGEIGVLLRSGAGTCNTASGMRFWAYSNEIEDNVIRGHIVGLQFGYGGPDVMTVKNHAGYNKLHGNGVGMHFKTDAVSNGGSTNDFAGTSLPFIDEHGHNFH